VLGNFQKKKKKKKKKRKEIEEEKIYRYVLAIGSKKEKKIKKENWLQLPI
jgi:hypothetical protein